jgi:hypothetical protein
MNDVLQSVTMLVCDNLGFACDRKLTVYMLFKMLSNCMARTIERAVDREDDAVDIQPQVVKPAVPLFPTWLTQPYVKS